jgi:hypothetical protein
MSLIGVVPKPNFHNVDPFAVSSSDLRLATCFWSSRREILPERGANHRASGHNGGEVYHSERGHFCFVSILFKVRGLPPGPNNDLSAEGYAQWLL